VRRRASVRCKAAAVQDAWADAAPSPWWPAREGAERFSWGPPLGGPPEKKRKNPSARRGSPAADERSFLTRLRRILAEYRRRGGHSRRLNPRRSIVLRVIRSEPAQMRILLVVDSCIASAARLPQRQASRHSGSARPLGGDLVESPIRVALPSRTPTFSRDRSRDN
jgi:hypothetical protein